ncbi:MAG: DUF1116 domain-containing protein [Chloroflexi bacterium]|nr:DUF1116 domain-containing protein [Chloroflexota bacterium]
MGPDCGTAIINGVPLGFANVVQRGDVGIVAASGTGLQQVSSLVDRWGAGISQAIGIGSHDLHARVGGISMLMGNEGLGKVLRFGANHPAVIERLNWMRDVLGPALSATLKALGAVELKPIIAQALHMGDECHNRNAAASGLLFKRLAPALIKTEVPRSDVSSVLSFVGGNDHFFLNISMAACKASLDAAHGVPGSSLVTVMARNGVDFGIRTSGTGDQWFTAPAPMVNGLYFTGYGPADAAPDLGDSAITETAGIGGFAMGAAPAIVQFVGGTPEDAIGYTREMYHITLGHNSAFTLPPLSFIGSPAGIDARKVADRRIAPVINTGIAHREAGVGQVGAGITRAPLACFDQAVSALAHRVGRGQAGGKEAPVTDSDLTPRFAFSRNQKTPR